MQEFHAKCQVEVIAEALRDTRAPAAGRELQPEIRAIVRFAAEPDHPMGPRADVDELAVRTPARRISKETITPPCRGVRLCTLGAVAGFTHLNHRCRRPALSRAPARLPQRHPRHNDRLPTRTTTVDAIYRGPYRDSSPCANSEAEAKRSTMTEIALTTDHLAFVPLIREELTCLQ
jgi:hypothetical protein